MSNFEKLKKQFGAEPKTPVQCSCLIAFCDQCDQDTETKVLFMKAGLGNACAVCGRLRRGNPYISKQYFNTLKPKMAEGGTYEAKAL